MRTTIVALAALLLLVGSFAATADDPSDHNAPTSVTATCGSTTSLVGWAAVIDVHLSGYDVYRKREADPSLVRINPQTVTITSYSDSGLSPATTYVYGVRAVFNDGHESAMSATASCTTQ